MIDPSVATAVESLVTRYIALSDGMHFAHKRAHWDELEATPVLAPEELGRPLVGWSEIDAYWNATKSSLASLHTTCWDIVIRPLSEDVVLVLFKQRWVARMVGSGFFAAEPLASTVRVSMGLRRREADWKIFMSVESHVDGVEYFRSVVARRAVALAPA